MTAAVSSTPARIPPALWAILGVSLLLRLVLAAKGGQGFYPDEDRFLRGIHVYQSLRDGDLAAARPFLMAVQHAGFTWVTALIAPFQHALAQFTPYGDWSRLDNVRATAELGAMLLGLFSTLNLWLVHRLSLATGAPEREALWAALLAAAANSLFYHSRHLLPYDCALSAALAGLLFTVTGRNRLRVFLGGAGAGLCFQIYNGYWFFVPITGLALWLYQPDWPARVRSTVWWSLGCLIPNAPVMLSLGLAYWTVVSGWRVTQGDFAEGWSLPWAYLWEAEHALGPVLLGAIVAALAFDGWTRRTPTRVQRWLILAAATYALFVLVSNGLQKFVMYGRTARALVPFLCLAGGYAADRLLPGRPLWRGLAAGTVVACAAMNFLPVFRLVFPAQVADRVANRAGEPRRATSFTGAVTLASGRPITRPDLVLVNAQPLYPLQDYAGYPRGRVLLSFPHPVAYAAYQFEGYSPRERRLLREHPPAIRLIQLAPEAMRPRPSRRD